MPVQFGNRNDALEELLDRIAPVEPVIPVEAKAAASLGCTSWGERLRTTEELLQKLSEAYPFRGDS